MERIGNGQRTIQDNLCVVGGQEDYYRRRGIMENRKSKSVPARERIIGIDGGRLLLVWFR